MNGKVNQFKLEDYHMNNFHGNISVVKVKNNHYAVLILGNDNKTQHVYIYKASEVVDKYGNYDYTWNYEEPICVSFNYSDYVPDSLTCVDATDEYLDEYYKKIDNWHKGKHIQNWIINNIK